jgi:ribosomal protein L32
MIETAALRCSCTHGGPCDQPRRESGPEPEYMATDESWPADRIARMRAFAEATARLRSARCVDCSEARHPHYVCPTCGSRDLNTRGHYHPFASSND